MSPQWIRAYVRFRCRECDWARYEVAYTDAESDVMQRRMRAALDEHQTSEHGGRNAVLVWTAAVVGDRYMVATPSRRDFLDDGVRVLDLPRAGQRDAA